MVVPAHIFREYDVRGLVESDLTPDNVRAVVHDCLRHRIILSYEANAEGITTDDAIREIVKKVAVA